jgi:zinc transport system substrate-binding protein
MRLGGRLAAVLVVFLTAASPVAAQGPRVVTTIRPVHALASAVMAGVGKPELLLRGNAAPETFSLRSADVRTMNSAALVVFVSEGLEGFIVRALENLPAETRVLELIAADGLRLLPQRHGPEWLDEERPRASPRPVGTDPGAEDPEQDPHIWLDPDNARAIAAAIADELADIDPAHADLYRRNLMALAERLQQIDKEIAASMALVKAAPYIVLHDAFQYFEKRYGVPAAGAITRRPDSRPSPRRVTQMRQRVQSAHAACVFGEPQFPQANAKMVSDGTAAKLGQLDPLGATLPETAEAYPLLLKGLAEGYRACLGSR